MADLSRSARVRTAIGAKRPRMSAGELREQMLSTALQVIEESGGLTVSLAHLNMEEIIRLAGVPRSSVYREWTTREAFYTSLLLRMVEPAPDQDRAFDPETLDTALRVIDAHRELLVDPDGRNAVLREAIRLGARRNFDALHESLNWRTITALAATLPAIDEEHRTAILDAVARAEMHFIDRMSEFYAMVFDTLGLRLRVGFTLRGLVVASSSVIEGLVRRSLIEPAVVAQPVRLPGIDGHDVDWHLSAVAHLGIFDLMVEADPDWTPSR